MFLWGPIFNIPFLHVCGLWNLILSKKLLQLSAKFIFQGFDKYIFE
jgi:hypothetical protein